jgi:hypothetical protein
MRLKTFTSWGINWVNTLIALLLTISMGSVFGQVATLDRDYEPVVISGSQLPEFIGFPVTYIHVYVYHTNSGEWEHIPSQVDEKDITDNETITYFDFDNHDGIFDELDEITIMAADMGDKVPSDTLWPEDGEADDYVRYEISATDLVSNGQAWAYVYLSSTLGQNDSLIPYVDYDPENDVVSGHSYFVAHHPDTASGLPTLISIPTEVGGDGMDLLDRWRLRFNLHAKIDLGFASTELDITLKERMKDFNPLPEFGDVKINVFQARPPDYITGPIRILRNMNIRVTIKGGLLGYDIDVEQDFSLQSFYYRTFIDFPPYPQEIPEIPPISEGEVRVTQFLVGTARTNRVFGLRYYSPSTDPKYQDIPIDENKEEVKQGSDINWPGTTWHGITVVNPDEPNRLSSATVLTVIRMGGQPPVSDYRRFFQARHDDPYPQYGVMGFWLNAPSGNIEGILDVLIRNFYFGENFSRQQMLEFAENYSTPLNVEATSSTYPDVTTPAKITDMTITSTTDSTITLRWMAPGDDGMTRGPAYKYKMRYYIEPMDFETRWQWWGAAYPDGEVYNLPKPGEPGTTDSMTVQGLNKNTTYYFSIRSRDETPEPDCWSDLSFPASDGTTTPVELISFVASCSRDQIELFWSTASETNNFGFEVQRRYENETEWQVIGFVDGAGTTNEPQSYTFVDKVSGLGQVSYRLRQIDTDGAFEFSHVIDATIAAPSRFALYQNYPNPFSTQGSIVGTAQTQISFEVPADYSGPLTLKVYDLLGREVRTLLSKNLKPGYHKVSWDGKDAFDRQVVSGVYVYVMSSDRFREARKMIKMR